MKTKRISTGILMSLFILLLFPQCSNKSRSEKEVSMAVDYSPPATESVSDAASSGNSSSSSDPIVIERKLTKEGHLTWETSNLQKTHDDIVKQIQNINGYIANDNQTRDEYEIRNSIELRLPAAQFDSFVMNLSSKVRKFDQKVINVVDVTEEYIDVTARIKTKKELEQHYYELLKKTKSVSEVLQVEEQLNNVRQDIESAEGRLKYLNDRISMSTIYLTFYETTSAPVGFFGEIGKSFVAGWKELLYFILGVIRAWPLVIILTILLVWFIKRRRRK